MIHIRGHQQFWNCQLLLVDRFMWRATSLIYISEIKILLNLPSIILVLIFVNVQTFVKLMLFLEHARGRLTLRATWCPRAPRWWPLVHMIKEQHIMLLFPLFPKTVSQKTNLLDAKTRNISLPTFRQSTVENV